MFEVPAGEALGGWLIAAIPSPADNTLDIGPLQVRFYGIAIAVGAIIATTIAQRRWAQRGGDPADVSGLATLCVLAGLVGARGYHVVTDFDRFRGNWWEVFAVWEGGLGIPGGLLAGVLAGVWLTRRRGIPTARMLDVAAPAIPVAQAIGRLGNWFNQEIFGGPTDLPWGLRIDPANRPAGFANVATYHPTFLYEALWNLALAAALVLYERRRPHLPPGRLFALYVAGYGAGRFWVESLRIDPAAHLLGIRVNLLVSGLAFVAAGAWLLLRSHFSAPTDVGPQQPEPAPATD